MRRLLWRGRNGYAWEWACCPCRYATSLWRQWKSPHCIECFPGGFTGPRTLRLVGKAADGVILTAGTSPEQVKTALGLAKTSQAVVYVHAATGPDAAARLEAERQRQGYDSMDDLCACGGAEAIAEAVRRWADAGAMTVALQPTHDDPDPEGFVRLVATEVRPLVR